MASGHLSDSDQVKVHICPPAAVWVPQLFQHLGPGSCWEGQRIPGSLQRRSPQNGSQSSEQQGFSEYLLPGFCGQKEKTQISDSHQLTEGRGWSSSQESLWGQWHNVYPVGPREAQACPTTSFFFFKCSKIYITQSFPSLPFLSVQFSSVRSIHIVVQPISRILFILQN